MKNSLAHALSAGLGAALVLLVLLALNDGRLRPDDGPGPALRSGDHPEPVAAGKTAESQGTALEDLRREQEALATRNAELEKDLAAARAELEAARRQLQAPPPVAATDGAGPGGSKVFVRRPGGSDPAPTEGGPSEGGPGDGLPRMKRYVVFGEGLTAEAVEKLGLTADEKASVDAAIVDEELRLRAALEMYARDAKAAEGPRPGESTAAFLSRLLNESGMSEAMMKFHEENPEAMQMMRDGRLSMRDILGEDSDAYRLLSAMRDARKATHEAVGQVLDADRAATFAGEIHPVGAYSFKGNLMMMMGGSVTPEDAAETAARNSVGK